MRFRPSALLVLLLLSPATYAGQWYESPFEWPLGWRIGISADGSAVAAGTHLWRPIDGKAIPLPGDFVAQGGITADGELLTGTVYGSAWTPYSWTQSGGLDRIDGPYNSSAFDVSDDGSAIVGSVSSEPIVPYRWSESEGVVRIPLPSGFTNAHGGLISGDGNVAVGFGWGQAFKGWHAYRWSQKDGSEDLGTFGGKEYYRASGISNDGSVIVGSGWMQDETTGERKSYEAYRWTREEGMVGLGTLPGSAQSWAQVVSEDGNLVLGTNYGEETTPETSLRELAEELFVWSEASGMQSLTEILSREIGAELPSNLTVRAMSADERTIVGTAENLTNRFDRQLWAVALDRPLSELLKTSVPGDFNGDGVIDVVDVNLLSEAIRAGSQDAQFDLDGSNSVELDDLSNLIHEKLNTWYGDANLDGEFATRDLVQVLEAGKYETQESAGWAEGDWNADGIFGTGDLVMALDDGGYERGPRGDAAAVPEPSGWLLLLMGLVPGLRRHLTRNAV